MTEPEPGRCAECGKLAFACDCPTYDGGDDHTTEPRDTLARFDGAAAWATLKPEDQAAIGAIALEFVVNMHGEDAYFTGLEAKPEARPFIAAGPLLTDQLMTAVADTIGEQVPALFDDELVIPIPSLLGPVCRVCRCSQEDACPEGCCWAEPDLCTACKALALQGAEMPSPLSNEA